MPSASRPRRVVIMGAAGRDFHNFNVVYRDDPGVEVVAFTAAQIPGIAGRRYPPVLSGPRYPSGIPIVEDAALEATCRAHAVDEVVFAYSDVSHEAVMHAASRALAVGADVTLLGPDHTMLRSRRPVIAVSATRTGTGKSQVTRWIAARLRARGLRVAVLRHPMPYGDLAAQRVQRFASRADLDAAACTVEEREEYEPHLAAGAVVFAGVDYAAVLALAEQEAQVILWDGGNNDFPFLRPDLHIVLVDALRAADAHRYHPGEAVLRMADAVVVAKCDAARPEQIEAAYAEARRANPGAPVVRGTSPVRLDDEAAVRGQRVVVVEDGPTVTHGGMGFGAGYVAALAAGAEVIEPLSFATPEFATALAAYPHLRLVLPALGYGEAQLRALEATLAATPVNLVVSGTPVDLSSLISIPQRIVRARYEYADAADPGMPTLAQIVDAALERLPV